MESLLRWSIENSRNSNNELGDAAPNSTARQDLDPGIIDMILGKPDSILMKEALSVGSDRTQSVEARLTALDDLEMLVEQIDNANNLKPLGMYPPLVQLFSSSDEPEKVRLQALWILGTAVQNNPQAQAEFITHDPLPAILSILSAHESGSEGSLSSETRSKAAYALSATMKHNAPAIARFSEAGGWEVLRNALADSEITIRRKVAFLIQTLLLPTGITSSNTTRTNTPLNDPVIHTGHAPQQSPLRDHAPPSSSSALTLHPSSTVMEESSSTSVLPPSPQVFLPTSTSSEALVAVRKYGIISALISALCSPLPHGPDADGDDFDVDFAEKAARAVHTFLTAGGTLTEQEKASLIGTMNDDAPGGSASVREAWGLDRKDWDDLREHVSALR